MPQRVIVLLVRERGVCTGVCKSNDQKKGVIDGDLVIKYTDLPMIDQQNLASAIGSTVDLIFDNLLEVVCPRMVV